MRLVWLMLIISISSVNVLDRHHALAVQIFPANAGKNFASKSSEPKYNIEFHPEDSPFHPDDEQESMIMPDKNGQKYLCFLPKVEKVESSKLTSQHNTSSVIVESEKRIKLKTPDELLEVLQDICLIRNEGWWSYEFCYGKTLRQLHVENDKVVEEFVLGVYDADFTSDFNQNISIMPTVKNPYSKDASQRYHAHQYTNGTICDLTNQPRETEVRFVCSEPPALISSIIELSTCKYALTVQCPMLCKHPLFQEEKPVWQTINCNILLQDNKEPSADKDNNFRDKEITMIKDINYPINYNSEHAT